MLSLIPTKRNQLSPIRCADGPPFSPERSFDLQIFLLLVFAFLFFIKRTFRFTSCNSRELHRPEPQACRLMSQGSYRPKNGSIILADNKRGVRLFGPPLSPEREIFERLPILILRILTSDNDVTISQLFLHIHIQ